MLIWDVRKKKKKICSKTCMRSMGGTALRVCANLFNIVNTGQHPDASVVEDGEFFCQFLLAGLDHSPRHLLLAVRLNLQSNPVKIPQISAVLFRKNREEMETMIYVVIRLNFAHVQPASCTPPHRLPACFSFFFFFFRSLDEELSWFSQRGWLMLRSRTLVNFLF